MSPRKSVSLRTAAEKTKRKKRTVLTEDQKHKVKESSEMLDADNGKETDGRELKVSNRSIKSKEHSADLRDKIVARHKSGQGYKTISKALNIPRSTVASIIVKWKKFGTTRTLPRVGRPQKLSKRAKRALVREVTKNPMVTLTELQKSAAVMGESVGKATISAALHRSGFYCKVVRENPL
ncbi:centrin-3 [Lates calcarifer]|uniref:Centrin-3 n=1 Tax=Lates calcarifer TaxID=8187 RepID=A0A4W6FAI0_LATCA|nr:centrin-3 [Lates calcarifer]